MKIAIVGTRGIPNRYGGFEQFAEKVSSTLADRGHEVTVYCRKPFTTPDDVYDQRVHACHPAQHPPEASRHVVERLDLHGARGLQRQRRRAALQRRQQSVCVVPAIVREAGRAERRWSRPPRGKWNALGQAALHVCEWLSVFTPTRVVTDAKPIQDYYRSRYRKDSTLIGYGSDIPPGDHKLDGFDLQPGRYVLVRQPSRAGEQS